MEDKMRTIDPGDIPVPDFHQYLLACVAPRPIAFASTIDKDGRPNLAPFSFFNVFGSNPPTAIFCPSRRVANNTTKDTLHNAQETGEVVINAVSYDIVRKVAVAGVNFPPDVSEFDTTHLTPIPSDLVKPYRVKESPAHLECKVKDIISLGIEGGAGNLIICDVLRIHVREDLIENNRVNPHKIDLMGRLGRAFYCRASGDAIHTIIQPAAGNAIGYDALPASAKNSKILNANDIGMLCGLHEVPGQDDIARIAEDNRVKEAISSPSPINALQEYAAEILRDKNVDNRNKAGAIIWYADTLS